MLPKHWCFRYFNNRLKVFIHDFLHPHDPWLTSDAILFLEKNLKNHFRGLEWGSGRSTVWFSERTSFLVSIETDSLWYEKTKGILATKGLSNQVKQILEPDPSQAILIADLFEAKSFDYVLVDGRPSRGACGLKAIEKLKPEGFLILDNANRYLPSDSIAPESRNKAEGPLDESFRLFQEHVRGWKTTWTSNGVWDTAIFQKPSS